MNNSIAPDTSVQNRQIVLVPTTQIQNNQCSQYAPYVPINNGNLQLGFQQLHMPTVVGVDNTAGPGVNNSGHVQVVPGIQHSGNANVKVIYCVPNNPNARYEDNTILVNNIPVPHNNIKHYGYVPEYAPQSHVRVMMPPVIVQPINGPVQVNTVDSSIAVSRDYRTSVSGNLRMIPTSDVVSNRHIYASAPPQGAYITANNNSTQAAAPFTNVHDSYEMTNSNVVYLRESSSDTQINKTNKSNMVHPTSKPTKDKIGNLNKPKRPLSAYNIFFRHERANILGIPLKESHDDKFITARKRRHVKGHGKISFSDLGKLIGQRWKNLKPDEMQVYQDLASKEKIEYEQMMEEYRSNHLKSKMASR